MQSKTRIFSGSFKKSKILGTVLRNTRIWDKSNWFSFIIHVYITHKESLLCFLFFGEMRYLNLFLIFPGKCGIFWFLGRIFSRPHPWSQQAIVLFHLGLDQICISPSCSFLISRRLPYEKIMFGKFGKSFDPFDQSLTYIYCSQ